MEKVKTYAIIILLIGIIGLLIYSFSLNNKIDKLNQKIALEKSAAAKKTLDSVSLVIDGIHEKYRLKTDSLKRLKEQIKYIPYEKFYYYDRSLDSALFIISEYKYGYSGASPTN